MREPQTDPLAAALAGRGSATPPAAPGEGPAAPGAGKAPARRHFRAILNLAVPLILANLVQQAYNMTDVFFLGRFRGSLALAAAGSASQVSWILVYIFVGLSVGAGIVTAQAYGARDPERLSRAVQTAWILGLLSGAALTLAGAAFSPALLALVNTPPEVLPGAAPYLRVHFASMLFYVIFLMAAAILRGTGDTRSAMWAICLALAVKLSLVALLVGAMGGGVIQAAASTVVAQAAAAAVVTARLVSPGRPCRLRIRGARAHWPTLAGIAAIGIPTGLQSLVQYLANVYFNSQVNRFGADVMAGVVTISRLEGIIYMPIEGFALAASTLAGQLTGAGRSGEIPSVMRQTSIMSVGLVILLTLAFFRWGEAMAGVFNPLNHRAVEVTLLFLATIVPFYFLYSLNQNFGGVIRGTGEARAPMLIVLFFTCGIRVLLISLWRDELYMLPLIYPASWAATFLAFIAYCRLGGWLDRLEIRVPSAGAGAGDAPLPGRPVPPQEAPPPEGEPGSPTPGVAAEAVPGAPGPSSADPPEAPGQAPGRVSPRPAREG
ncbi:MAG: MATE family efflux transporter [Deltaproteobacteria bacterium]|jgi:putative MATE family efflux protein|nr:MATE family efflux transporter [Deltaproteobacteria bacterium]